MRSQPSKPPRSMKRLALFDSAQFWRMPRENGLPRTGRSARLRRRRGRSGWVRRCSLFTLVGIAGEDDLDAPDLMDPAPETGKLKINSKSGGNGGRQVGSSSAGRRPEHKSASAPLQPELSLVLSASLR